MSTADVAPVWSFHPGGHPDATQLRGWRAALDAWEARAWSGSPTGSLAGGGAVAAFEAEFAARLDRPTLLLPSATFGLRLALEVLGVGRDDDVLVPVVDWPATYAAVRSLGARPVPVPVDPATMTMDPVAAAVARTRLTRAAVACHFAGIPADVPAIGDALDVPVVEDCAGAPGSLLDGRPVGTLGALAVFSLGPGKRLDAGEGGVLVSGGQELHARAVAQSSHPLRLLRHGIDPATADPTALVGRPHPLAAVLGLHALAGWTPEEERAEHAAAARRAHSSGHRVLGLDPRRASASAYVPVSMPEADANAGCVRLATGAQVLPAHAAIASDAAALLARVRLLPVQR